ncbi:MAG: hypothetical protein HY718_18830 [Planctomycetes bacterium]|nr:hypothetical protein [Planctomycetota bacterium]
MAKTLGMNPRKLIKNIPSKSQPWKAPVHVWIRDLYEKMQEKAARRRAAKQAAQAGCPQTLGQPPAGRTLAAQSAAKPPALTFTHREKSGQPWERLPPNNHDTQRQDEFDAGDEIPF